MVSDRCSVLSCLSVCLSVTLVYYGQTVGWLTMKLGMQVGLGPGHIVLDGDPAPLPKKGTEPPNFRPISIVAKWLDGPRCHLLQRQASAQATLSLMGTQLPKKKGTAPHPIFGPCLLWLNGSMDEDATWYGSRP